MTQKFVQNQATTLAGSGASIGDTSLSLTSFTDPDGNLLAMTDFGSKGWGTLEPNNGAYEEPISFTGITQNDDGTATLTGVKSILFKTPYTETSGLTKAHAGGIKFVISNNPGMYTNLVSKVNDETITGVHTFSVSPIVPDPTTAMQPTTKRYVDVKRVSSITTTTSFVPNLDSYQEYTITALAETLTVSNPSGTPTQGQTLIIRIKDNGSAQGLNWGTTYRELGTALPSTTIASKTMYLGFIWNSTDSKLDLIGKAVES